MSDNDIFLYSFFLEKWSYKICILLHSPDSIRIRSSSESWEIDPKKRNTFFLKKRIELLECFLRLSPTMEKYESGSFSGWFDITAGKSRYEESFCYHYFMKEMVWSRIFDLKSIWTFLRSFCTMALCMSHLRKSLWLMPEASQRWNWSAQGMGLISFT